MSLRVLAKQGVSSGVVGVLALVGMTFDAACSAAFTFVIKPMLDDLFVHKDKATIFWMPIFIIGLFLVRGMATYTAGYNMAKIARGVIQTLREEVFRKYLTLPAAFFQRESERLLARLFVSLRSDSRARVARPD